MVISHKFSLNSPFCRMQTNCCYNRLNFDITIPRPDDELLVSNFQMCGRLMRPEIFYSPAITLSAKNCALLSVIMQRYLAQTYSGSSEAKPAAQNCST